MKKIYRYQLHEMSINDLRERLAYISDELDDLRLDNPLEVTQQQHELLHEMNYIEDDIEDRTAH